MFLLPSIVSQPSYEHLSKHLRNDVVHRASRIIVVDGPLHQPILDYLFHSGINEHYESAGTENTTSPGWLGKALEFQVPPMHPEDRISAMRQAAAQAEYRRQVGQLGGPGQA